MNEPDDVPDRLKDLVDDYLKDLLDESRFHDLEELLSSSATARRYFVRYARLETDLHLEFRARLAAGRALGQIERLGGRSGEPSWTGGAAGAPAPAGRAAPTRRRVLAWAAVAVAFLLIVGLSWWFGPPTSRPAEDKPQPAIAWLVNAQNCRWSEAQEPVGDLRPGKVLPIERGLAEIRFEGGAVVLLEGPARLELLSAHSARLHTGKMLTRVPAPGTGFEVLSPQGRLVDRGTEFGVAVSATGTTEVYVFEGTVEAQPVSAGTAVPAVSLKRDQGARIAAGRVTLEPAAPQGSSGRFVRSIAAAPVVRPTMRRLTFRQPVAGSLRDAAGAGTGLTHRLPGTGMQLAADDANLRLVTQSGHLELTTTNSDLNQQWLLGQGEYLGMRLADLGFTGKEDFAVTATLLAIPALEFVGQFGLYAGAASDRAVRGGLLGRRQTGQYSQFLVNTQRGRDRDLYTVGLLSTGADLRLTLTRKGGKYALTVENLREGGTSTLTIRHPAFLDDERDLFVGLFGANTQSKVRRTLTVKEFEVTVWTTIGTKEEK
jgi:ferric-dicitrate binding protein FerR (iron transport regulator)